MCIAFGFVGFSCFSNPMRRVSKPFSSMALPRSHSEASESSDFNRSSDEDELERRAVKMCRVSEKSFKKLLENAGSWKVFAEIYCFTRLFCEEMFRFRCKWDGWICSIEFVHFQSRPEGFPSPPERWRCCFCNQPAMGGWNQSKHGPGQKLFSTEPSQVNAKVKTLFGYVLSLPPLPFSQMWLVQLHGFCVAASRALLAATRGVFHSCSVHSPSLVQQVTLRQWPLRPSPILPIF